MTSTLEASANESALILVTNNDAFAVLLRHSRFIPVPGYREGQEGIDKRSLSY